jgi:hypothetical protein
MVSNGYLTPNEKCFSYIIGWTNYSEWVSDCCLTPLISWREQINFQWYDYDDDEVHFVLDQHV